MLSREDILSKNDLKREVVSVPEWSGDICVSEMTAAARDEWEQAIISKDDGGRIVNPRAKLVAATVIDPDSGKLLFTESDILALSRLSAKAIDRITDVAQRINGLSSQAIDAIDAAEKN